MAARLNVATVEAGGGGHLGDAVQEEQVWQALLAAA